MENTQRDMNFQTIGWFWDIFKRELLLMDPPYQRRSVWNQEYKDYFVDTVLHGYPAPAIFLFRETTPDGISKYSVVDGKQRLSTLFEFASNVFPVGEKKKMIQRFVGKYFNDLPSDTKTAFWNYRFAVEYLPSDNEEIISNIFDRINRNVAKLTPQELRHARFSGEFMSKVEELSEWLSSKLPPGVPNILAQSRKQMKDNEFISQLLLLIEEGPKSYSQEDLDVAFADREESWESKNIVTARFQDIIDYIAQWAHSDRGLAIFKSRLRNQADFFSLIGAINEIINTGRLSEIEDSISKLENFVRIVDDPEMRLEKREANTYYNATRYSSSDAKSRRTRIDIIKSVLLGEI